MLMKGRIREGKRERRKRNKALINVLRDVSLSKPIFELGNPSNQPGPY